MLNRRFSNIIEKSLQLAKNFSHEYVTLEHILLTLMDDSAVIFIMINCGVNTIKLQKKMLHFLENELISIVSSKEMQPKFTMGVERAIKKSIIYNSNSSDNDDLCVINLLIEVLTESDTYGSHFLYEQGVSCVDIISFATKIKENGKIIKNESCSEKSFENTSQSKNPNYDLPIFFHGEIEYGSLDNEIQEEKELSFLQQYSVNLNQKVLNSNINPVTDREQEIERIMRIMCCKQKNNIILVGEPGVGKTAIVEGIAYMIAKNKAPKQLRNSVIYMLDISAVLAGTKYRGDFEERMRMIIKDLSSTKNAIVFIDEIQSIVGAGATNGSSLDASNILKPPLSRGEIRCIGTTTYKEYSGILSKDKAFIRRFYKINIDEPSLDRSVKMLSSIKNSYEQFYNVHYSDKVISDIVYLSDRFIGNNSMPDKAIGVLDEVGSYFKIKNNNADNQKEEIKIEKRDIAKVISDISKIPIDDILGSSEIGEIKQIEKNLLDNIFGQEEAIKTFCNKLTISKLQIHEENKPIGSFLLYGPTGVGKTELAKQISNHLHMNLVRVDMSEYSEQHSISKLIGSPPGYVGHENGSIFSDSVYYNPYSVVLLDEIEKAHGSIYNSLLQILDYGKMSDSTGRSVNFRNTIIIMTTNLGAEHFDRQAIGFCNEEEDHSIVEINNHFSPEFINRMSAIIKFNQLTPKITRQIVEKILKSTASNMSRRGIEIEFTDSLKDYIVEKNMQINKGARLLDKFMIENVSPYIAKVMMENSFYSNCKIKVDYKKSKKSDGKVIATIKAKEQKISEEEFIGMKDIKSSINIEQISDDPTGPRTYLN